MPILSVDLSYRSWSDLGVVVLEQKASLISCDLIRWTDPYRPPVVELALRLNQLCEERNASLLMLDGPQAWKSENEMPKATRSESGLISESSGDMPAGDGMAGNGSATYERFVGYCLALYDALGRLGWRRLGAREQADDSPSKILVESYPQAAWRSLGIAPLPPRRDCRVSHLAEAYAALTSILAITTSQPPNHNQLQAIVGGLPGLAMEERLGMGLKMAGGVEDTTQVETPATIWPTVRPVEWEDYDRQQVSIAPSSLSAQTSVQPLGPVE